MLALDQPNPSWGDTITFSVTAPPLKPKERLYVTVIGFQDELVFQYSTREALDWKVPLVQQDGLAALGHLIDLSESGDFSASLIRRLDRKEDVISTLETISFTVNP